MSRLILADKSDLFKRSLSSTLSREGHDVWSAESGFALLKLCHETQPDLIILDTELENPGAFVILERLKSSPPLRQLPVIVVSRDSSATLVSQAYRMGADAFLVKPIEVNSLLKTIEKLRSPIPSPTDTMEWIVANTPTVKGRLRFIDRYGQIYMHKDHTANEGIIGALGTLTFKSGKETCKQLAMLIDENDEGLSLMPLGAPAKGKAPGLYRLSVHFKARYMIPGDFVRLADVAEMRGHELTLTGLTAEPRFNSPLKLTLFPVPLVKEHPGIPMEGHVTSFRSNGSGAYDADVLLAAPWALPYVNLLAELVSGRPALNVLEVGS